MKTPRRTGVRNTLFQNSPQSFTRTWFRHQSGPPPCSAPNTTVPASWLAGPLTFAEPVAVSASAKSTAPAKSQSLRRCIYSLRSVRNCERQPLLPPSHLLAGGGPHSAIGEAFLSRPVRRGDPLFVRALLGPEGVCSGHDLEDFLGDLRLASPVHGEGEAVDELSGVLRGVSHRRHSCPVLRSGRFQEGPVELCLDVDRQEPLQDLLGLGLEDEVASHRIVGALLVVCVEEVLGKREDVLHGHLLDQGRFEMVV